MIKKKPLYKLTYDAFEWLYNNVDDNIAHYRDPETNFAKILEKIPDIVNYRELVPDVYIIKPFDLRVSNNRSSGRPNEADQQAIDFYYSFEGLTPRIASDPLVLAYINHFYLHKYGISRWPTKKNISDSNYAKNTQLHWITKSAENNTEIYRSSIAGRTWWIAYTAITVANNSKGEFNAKHILEKFSKTAEYYHRIMEYSIFRNPLVLTEFVRSLFYDAKDINIKGYISMAQALNREAGAILLDSLDRSSLRQLIQRIAQNEIKNQSRSTDPSAI